MIISLATITPTAKVPISTTKLLPYDGKAEPRSVTAYQQKTGSILYAVIITRPDVTFTASRLVRFNNNPGPQHHRATDQTLHYLHNTLSEALHIWVIDLGSAKEVLIAKLDL